MDMDRKGCTLEKVASLVLSSLGLGKDLLALFCLAFFTFFYFLSGITCHPILWHLILFYFICFCLDKDLDYDSLSSSSIAKGRGD
jgi:hypothetical protein